MIRCTRLATRRLLLGACLMCLTSGAGMAATANVADPADMPPAALQPGADIVRGRFTQEKHLAEMDRPLISSGTFVAARGKGLIWRVEKPVRSELIVTDDRLVQRSNGRETTRLTADKQPALGVVASALMAVFQGDTRQLHEYFSVDERRDDGDSWTLRLSPATPAIGEFVRSLTLTGSQRVERIRIDQPGGDYSVIRLQPPTAQTSDELSADERAAFAP